MERTREATPERAGASPRPYDRGLDVMPDRDLGALVVGAALVAALPRLSRRCVAVAFDVLGQARLSWLPQWTNGRSGPYSVRDGRRAPESEPAFAVAVLAEAGLGGKVRGRPLAEDLDAPEVRAIEVVGVGRQALEIEHREVARRRELGGLVEGTGSSRARTRRSESRPTSPFAGLAHAGPEVVAEGGVVDRLRDVRRSSGCRGGEARARGSG